MNYKQTEALILILKTFNTFCIILSVFLIKIEILSILMLIIGILGVFTMLFFKVYYLEHLKRTDSNDN